MTQKSLFRKVALERLSSPEQLDQLMQVTTPRAWLALVGLACLLVAVLTWGIFGTIQSTEIGQGILIRGGGVQLIQSTHAGQVVRLYVQPGDSVQQGQQVASVLPINGAEQTQPLGISSPWAGRVLEIRVNEGGIVQAGTPLLSLEPANESLQAVVYLAPAGGKGVQPGMVVQISPSTVHKEDYGVMLGKVIAVGEFPATEQGMLRVLGSEELVQALSAGGAPIEVRVELSKAQNTSGYQWSSPQGPPFAVGSGTFCTASIVVAEKAPISLVLGGPR